MAEHDSVEGRDRYLTSLKNQKLADFRMTATDYRSYIDERVGRRGNRSRGGRSVTPPVSLPAA